MIPKHDKVKRDGVIFNTNKITILMDFKMENLDALKRYESTEDSYMYPRGPPDPEVRAGSRNTQKNFTKYFSDQRDTCQKLKRCIENYLIYSFMDVRTIFVLFRKPAQIQSHFFLS